MADLRIDSLYIYTYISAIRMYNPIYISIGSRPNFFFPSSIRPRPSRKENFSAMIGSPPNIWIPSFIRGLYQLCWPPPPPCIYSAAMIRTTLCQKVGIEDAVVGISLRSLPEVLQASSSSSGGGEGRFESMILNGPIREKRKKKVSCYIDAVVFLLSI